MKLAAVRRRMSPPSTGLSKAGYSRDHPLELEKSLAIARRSGAGIREEKRWVSAADQFTVVIEPAGLNAKELSAYCRER